MKKKLLTLAASAFIVAGGIFAYFAIMPNADALTISGCKRDAKDGNSILSEGACNTGELQNKYNSTSDAPAIFNHYGVPTNFGDAVEGKVHKDGRVTVDGETVATGAKTVGRKHISGSSKVNIGGKTYYERAPKVSFQSESIKAFVFLDKHGEFVGAIISSCGNPVTGNPKPKPEFACKDLNVVKVDRTRFDLSVQTSEHRANFNSVTYNVYNADGDKIASPTSDSKDYRLTLDEAGEYIIKAAVTFDVQGKGQKTTKETARCTTTVKVKEEPCPYNPDLPKGHPDCEEPVEPAYACDKLDVEKIGRTDFRFTTTTSQEHAEFEHATYIITNEDGDEVDRIENADKTVDYSVNEADTYKVRTIVSFTVDGETKTIENENCADTFTVEEEPKEEEPCPYDENLPKGHPDCVKPEEPETPEEPTEKGEEAPAEMPKTGAGSVISAFAGISSLAGAGYYYLGSRRELLAKLLDR